MNIFVNCWRGKAPLWKAFWVVGFLFSLILDLILIAILHFAAPDIDVVTRNHWLVLLMFPYNLFVTICVWRCGKNSAVVWSILSKIVVVLGLLTSILDIYRFITAA